MPISPNPAYQTGVSPVKATLLANGVFRVGSKDELRNYDWNAAGIVYVNSELFYRDTADTISQDNDSTIIVDQEGVRWKKGAGGYIAVHAAGTFSERASKTSGAASPRADGSLFVYFSTDGDGDTITDGVFFFKQSNGDEWSAPVLFRGPRGGDRYEMGNWDTDRPASDEELFSWLMTTNVTFPANFLGSRAKARVASTGVAVYSIRKNDVEIGTMTFSASVNGVFAMASETSFTDVDDISIVAPDPRDATLSGVRFTLVGTR